MNKVEILDHAKAMEYIELNELVGQMLKVWKRKRTEAGIVFVKPIRQTEKQMLANPLHA